MNFKLLLVLSLFCNTLMAQKKARSISIMAGIPIMTKGDFHDYTIPLTIEYEFRKGKHGFSVGLQPEYSATNWRFKGDNNELIAYCKASVMNISTAFASNPLCQYSIERQSINLNFPVFYSFLLLKDNKFEGSIQTGFILNYNWYYHSKSEYPKIDFQGNIVDLGPFTDTYTSKRFKNDGLHAAIRGVLRYKILKNLALSSILEYQHGFDDFHFKSSGSKKLFLYLGTTFKI